MNSFTLLSPFWIPILVLCVVLARRVAQQRSQDSWHRVMPQELLQFLGYGTQANKSRWNISLLLAALTAAALTAPSVRIHTNDTFQQSHGWLAVVDVSRSMTLDDVAPSRIGGVRNGLLDMSEASGAYPLSLILYSGDAFLVAPPAFDKRLFNEQVAQLDHGIIPLEGSNLARALSLADSVIRDSEIISTRIFVYSDGGGLSKRSIAAARHLAAAGHRVDFILTGSTTDGTTAVAASDVQDFVNAGRGDLLTATALGAIDIDKLSPNSWASASSQSLFDAIIWRNQSHWLLLLLAPLLWWALREDFA